MDCFRNVSVNTLHKSGGGGGDGDDDDADDSPCESKYMNAAMWYFSAV
jgi:hypothetical protein